MTRDRQRQTKRPSKRPTKRSTKRPSKPRKKSASAATESGPSASTDPPSRKNGTRGQALADRARVQSARMRDLGVQARDRIQSAGRSAVRSAGRAGSDGANAFSDAFTTRGPPTLEAHLCFVQSPRRPIPPLIMGDTLRVATYNVHRWQGANGRSKPDVARAGYVISELDADVIALQEVLRPFATDPESPGQSLAIEEDPLARLCDELDLHLAFAVTRRHRRGQLGNAILSRFPITAISVIDISYSRIERRGALAAQIGHAGAGLGVVATHLSLVDRTRHRQVQSLLEHPQMNSGPAVLMGDMNAWRKCKGSQELEESLNLHHNVNWPSSFPAARPMLALDRIYSRGADVLSVAEHDSPAARKASDHLPIVAEMAVKQDEMRDSQDRSNGPAQRGDGTDEAS